MQFLRRSQKTILIIILIATATLALSTTISIILERINHLRLPSLGTIHTLGVTAYGGNITVQDGAQLLDWGTVYPGTQTNRSFNIRSKSNIQAQLIIQPENWTFNNSNGVNVTESLNATLTSLNLTSPQNGTIILPNQTVYVTLTISTSSSPEFIHEIITNDVQTFSFDIIIYASED